MAARMLNKLLLREEWARDRLARHAGKTAGFDVGHINLALSIQADGLVQPSDKAVVPNVRLIIPASRLSELPEVLRARDPSRLTELMHIEGDAGLAQVVSELAKDLRWDLEDDLAKVVGDVAATRIVRAADGVRAGAQAAVSRLAGNVEEYLSEESTWLVKRSAYDDWAKATQVLAQKLDRLDQRVALLGSRTKQEG